MENTNNTNTDTQSPKGKGIGAYLLIAVGFLGLIYLLKLLVDFIMK